MNFNFCGTFGANTDENAEKGYFYRSGSTKKNDDYASINVFVQANQNNRAYAELFGMKQDEIYTFDTDRNQMTVNWKDRNKEDIIKKVANFRKVVVSVKDKERKEFVSSYDAVEYIKDNIDDIIDKNVVITGTVNKDFYKGKARDRFQINNIYLAREGSKPGLNLTGVFYYTKDSVDLSEWKSDKKIIFNGWTREYVADLKAQKYVERTLILDASKVDFKNEKHLKKFTFTIKQYGLGYDAKKGVVNNLHANKVYSISALIRYTNGAEEVEFDESLLTDNQREAIELGVKTIDDFRPKGGVYGDRVVVYNLTGADLREPYENGCITEDFTVKEFEEDIYTPPKPDDDDDFINVPEDSDEEVPFDSDDDDEDGDGEDEDLDLF